MVMEIFSVAATLHDSAFSVSFIRLMLLFCIPKDPLSIKFMDQLTYYAML